MSIWLGDKLVVYRFVKLLREVIFSRLEPVALSGELSLEGPVTFGC